MNLFDLFRPKWKNSNWLVRLAAIQKVTNQSVLEHVARNDKDGDVRSAAVQKIANQSVLEHVVKNDGYWKVREAAIRNVTNQSIIEHLAKNDEASNVRVAAIQKVTNQSIIKHLAKNDKHSDVRVAAIQKVTNQSFLEYAAKNDKDSDVRMIAYDALENKEELKALFNIYKIKDIDKRISYLKINFFFKKTVFNTTEQEILIHVAKNDQDGGVRSAAIIYVTNQSVLEHVARNDKNGDVRRAAVQKITNQSVLEHVVKNDGYWKVREAAIRNVTNQSLLMSVKKYDNNLNVRKTASFVLNPTGLMKDLTEGLISSNELCCEKCGEIYDFNKNASMHVGALWASFANFFKKAGGTVVGSPSSINQVYHTSNLYPRSDRNKEDLNVPWQCQLCENIQEYTSSFRRYWGRY